MKSILRATLALGLFVSSARGDVYNVPTDFTLQEAVNEAAASGAAENFIHLQTERLLHHGEIVIEGAFNNDHRLVIRPDPALTTLQRVTLVSDNGAQPILRIADAGGITLQDLDLIRHITNQRNLLEVLHGNNIVIERCRVGSDWTTTGLAGYANLHLMDPQHIVVRNCLFFAHAAGTLDAGIRVFMGTAMNNSVLLYNNTVSDHELFGIDITAHGDSFVLLRNNVVVNRAGLQPEPFACRADVDPMVQVVTSHNTAFAAAANTELLVGVQSILGVEGWLNLPIVAAPLAFFQTVWVIDPLWDANLAFCRLRDPGPLHNVPVDAGILVEDGAPHVRDVAVLDDWEQDSRPPSATERTDRGADQIPFMKDLALVLPRIPSVTGASSGSIGNQAHRLLPVGPLNDLPELPQAMSGGGYGLRGRFPSLFAPQTMRVAPDIALTPAGLYFGLQTLGGLSPPQTVQVQNVGSANLHIFSITSSSAEFLLAPGNMTLPVAVAPGGHVTFQVRFAPTAPGSRNGAVTIGSDDPDESTRMVTCNGTGVDSPPTISAIADQTILENTSTGPLPFTVMDLETPAANLVLSATSSNTVLVPAANVVFGGSGSNRTVTVTPVADQSGTSLITVTVHDDNGAAASEPFLLTVTASGEPDIDVMPATLAFGSQMLGSTSPVQTVTVQNKGSATLRLNSVSSSSAEFVVSTVVSLPATVASTSNFTFQVQFAPAGLGTRNGTISITSDDPDEPALPVGCSGTAIEALDFGDAPDPDYPTRLANDGARHRLGSLFLGARVDPEADGQPDFPADQDDHNGGPDDEDGVMFMEPLSPGAVVNVTVIASGVGKLNAWIDFNQNGGWEPAEQIFNCRGIAAGPNVLEFTVPAGVPTGDTYARFRVSTLCPLGPAGLAADGEVEDYRVYIRAARLVPNIAGRMVNGLPLLEWDAPGTLLEQGNSVTGPFSVVPGATSPFAPPAGQAAARFYRLRAGPGLGDFDLAAMTWKADLVFDGTVTSVQYRSSDTNAEHSLSLPHAFVTFQVHEVLKGRVSGQTICLRFIGGPMGDGRILFRSDSTLFDPGERSVLFVKNNGRWWLPLVGGWQGRFRIVDDQAFSERGQELIWTSEARLSVGRNHDLLEVEQNLVGSEAYRRKRVQKESEGDRPVPPDGTHLGATTFKLLLKTFVQRAHTAQELTDPPPAASCDISAPFYVRTPTPKTPPPDPEKGP